MDEWIKQRINRIEDLKDRRALRDAVAGALVEIDLYNKDLYTILEDRLRNELADYRLEFDIYTAICSKEDFDPINDFFFPMDLDDLKPILFDLDELLNETSLGREVPLCRIFLECETPKIKDLLKENKIFPGKLYADGGIYDVSLTLRPCMHYKNKIADLYQSYMFNDVAWKTINAPYLEKFVDVILVSPPKETKGNAVHNIEIDLLEYEPYKLTDRMPIWNVRNLEAKCTFFPMPAYDAINYEHTISTQNLGKSDNYIVRHNNDGILYVKRNLDELVVVTPEDKVREWELVAIHSPREVHLGWIEQAIFSNARTHTFLERYAATLSMAIRSKGEIERILHSFREFEGWHLIDAIVLEKKQYWQWKMSNDANFFLADHVRIEEEKNILELQFTSNVINNYVLLDRMHFFVSEVQMAFPEYGCIGRMVKI